MIVTSTVYEANISWEMDWQGRFSSMATWEPQCDTSWYILLEICKGLCLQGKNLKSGPFERRKKFEIWSIWKKEFRKQLNRYLGLCYSVNGRKWNILWTCAEPLTVDTWQCTKVQCKWFDLLYNFVTLISLFFSSFSKYKLLKLHHSFFLTSVLLAGIDLLYSFDNILTHKWLETKYPECPYPI